MAGPLIDGTVTAPKQGQVQRPKNPPAPVWWFRGVKYTSYAAYNAAVARYNLALTQAAARSAASRTVAARASWQQQNAARLAQQQTDARLRAEQAATLARQRALYAQNVAQRRRLALGVAERNRQRLEAAERARLQVAAHRHREDQLTQVRRAAWNTVAGQQQALTAQNIAARRQMAAGTSPVFGPQPGRADVAPGHRLRSRMTQTFDFDPGAVRAANRRQMIATAEQTGDYTNLLGGIEAQMRRTNGRYFDEAAYTEYLNQATERAETVRTDYQELYERVNALIQAGKFDEAQALMSQSGNQQLVADAIRLFGDGRSPGAMERVSNISGRINNLREGYLERVYLGAYAGRDLNNAGEREIARFRDQFRPLEPSTEVGSRFRGPGLLDEDIPRTRMSLKDWLDRQYEIREREVERQAGMSLRQLQSEQGIYHKRKGGVQTVDRNGPGDEDDVYLVQNQDGTWSRPGEYQMKIAVERMLEDPDSTVHVPFSQLVRLAEIAQTGRFDEQHDARARLTQLIEELVNSTSQGPGRQRTLPPGASGQAIRANEFMNRWQPEADRARDAQINAILRGFGVDDRSGLGGNLESLTRAPVASQILGAMGVPLGWGSSMIREGMYRVFDRGGTQLRPEFRFSIENGSPQLEWGTENQNGVFKEGWGFLPGGGDFSPAARREFEGHFREYEAAIARADRQGFFEGMGTRAQAWSYFQSVQSTGNAGILYDTLADPLSWIGPARFIRAGQLALAEAGGVRAAMAAIHASPQGISSLLRNFSRYVAPGWMGGAGRAGYTEAAMLARASKFSKISIEDLRIMGDRNPEALAEIAERMMRGERIDEIIKHVDGFEALYKKSEVSAQQLLTWVQDEFSKQPGRMPPPHMLAGMIEEAATAQRLSQQAVAHAAQVELEAAARSAALEALHETRVVRAVLEPGAPLPGKPRLPIKAATGGAQKKVNRLSAAVQQTLAAQAKVAQKAAEAADILRDGKIIDSATRIRAYEDLRTTLNILDQYRDLPVEIAQTRGRSPIGIVSKRKAELRAYRTRQGIGEGVLTYAEVDKLRLQGDKAFIIQQLGAARTALKTATPAQAKRIRVRIARLEAALEGVAVEGRVGSGAAGVVRRTRKSKAVQISETFSASKVARTQVAPGSGVAELGRELYARFTKRQVEPTPTFSAARKAQYVRAEELLTRTALQITPEVEEVLAVNRAVGVENMNLAEAFELAQYLRKDYVSIAGFDDAVSVIERQVAQVLRSQSMSPAEYSVWVNWGHNAGSIMDLDAYRHVDPLMANEVRRVTGAQKRRGAYRSVKGGVEKLSELDTPFVLRDNDPVVLLAKMRLLRREGYSLAAYDEARSVLGEISRRAYIGEDLAKKAHKMGGDVLANFKQLREAKRQLEGEHDFEQFVNEHLALGPDSELLGAGDEALFNAWVESRVLDDMRPAVRSLTAYQESVLKASLGKFVDVNDPAALKGFLQGATAPPFASNNIGELRRWLVENGFWTPKTGEDIASGARVWSIADEREFWQIYYDWTPPWTEEAELRVILKSPQDYLRRMREWGFLENDFEKLSGDTDIETVRTAIDAIAFGGKGVKKARTYEELRAWFAQRYGELVVDPATGQFMSVPWMMTMDEYQAWFGRMADEANLTFIDPVSGEKVYAIKDFMRAAGLDPTLATPEDMAGVARAMRDSVPAHLARVKAKLRDAGVVDDLWLPEERMRFAYEIVDALLTEQSWRSWYRRMPIAQRVLAVAGLQRLLVTMTVAFPTMNVIDSYGPKAGMISLLRNRGRWIHSPKEAWYDLISRDEVAGTMRHTWANMEARAMANDPRFSLWMREKAGVQWFVESPMRWSGMAEEVLRYNTAVSVAGRTYDDLVKGGMDPVAARALARAEGMRAVDTFFSNLENAPDWLLALNQIVPFLTYSYKNSMLGLRILYEMPWIFQIGQRLGEGVREWNRERWHDMYGDSVPYDESDPQNSQIWFNLPGDDQPYSIDLSMFSDWTRALMSLTDENRDFYTNFFRVPHPIQTAIFGIFTGGETAWGTKADWTQLSPWFELFNQLENPAEFDHINPKSMDLVQWMSMFMFFKGFGRVDPIRARAQTFFALMDVDETKGWEYYNDHPDLEAFFALNGVAVKPFQTFKMNWWTLASEEQIEAYNQAFEGYNDLKDIWDREAGKYFLEPWSREARAAKRERQAALRSYLLAHPVLADAWAFTSNIDEWNQLQEDFKVDMEVDDFFAIKLPNRSKFGSDLEYANAMLEYVEHRRRFLENHPAVVVRFTQSQSMVERAWYEQELQWSEVLEQQAHVKIAIATEEAKPTPDRDLVGFLYDISEGNYQRLNMESYGQFYDYLGPELDRQRVEGQRGPSLLSRVSVQMDRVKTLVKLPGRADFFYEQASDQERVQIRADEAYHAALGGMMDELKVKGDFGSFWTELRRRGLLNRYLRENPSKRIDYAYSSNISRIFNKGGAMQFWDNLMAEPYWLQQYLSRPSAGKTVAEKQETYQRILVGKRYYTGIQAVFNASRGNPGGFYDELAKQPWLQAEYFRRHPEKAGGGGMTAYGIAMQALFAESKDGRDFMERLGANPALQAEYFRRNPDAAARFAAGREYFNWMQRWVQALSKNDHTSANEIWESMPAWVHEKYFSTHPEQRTKFAQGSAYSAAMGKWVDLLKAGKDVEAAAYFRSMPEWVRERYYTNHPDQRARNELSNEMLAMGAEYFLAPTKDMKLAILNRNPQLRRWLAEHGGQEAEMRGLINAIYRAIPKDQAWLRRKFLEAYPEIFSKEAAGVRKIARVTAELAAHPEMKEPYERALAIQTRDYTEQLRLNKAPPKQLNYERKKRLRKRSKRRAARMHSQWRHFMALR